MNAISIPLDEFQNMQDELRILKDSDLMLKMNHLIDLLYADKYGLYMHDFTDDLTEYSLNTNWNDETSPWDKV